MEETNKNKSDFGMIGLGTMGSNLLQNIADHGFYSAGYDIDEEKVNKLNNIGSDTIRGFSDMGEFIDNLKSPKVVMLLVPAGMIVDTVIGQLGDFLSEGDIIIDGGNSNFMDTERRFTELEKNGFHFIGMGVSGGEEGARKGPSMMPGGDEKAYEHLSPILNKIAAHVNGDPTVAYMGERSAGHFVKMVHNGIEYSIMQLISETYEIMKMGLKMDNEAIHKVFKKWNQGRLKSYLLEITADIFAYKEKDASDYLLDLIKDEAKAKGTGKWTSQAAMDLNLPVPIIDIAVSMRDLSKYKTLRISNSKVYPNSIHLAYDGDTEEHLKHLEQAFYFAMVSAYSQGMHLLLKASENYEYNLKLDIIAKIWRGGCIIRSEFLEDIYDAYNKNHDLQHLFLDKSVSKELVDCLPGIRNVVSTATAHGIAIPAFAVSLSYFDNLRNQEMPANLIQAQRDFFGSHTYELKGKDGIYHTEWELDTKKKTIAE